MTALDTNVFVRFLVDDDAEQGTRAKGLISSAVARGESLHVSYITLCEVVWVLTTAYGFSRDRVAGVLDALLHARELSFADVDACLMALRRFRNGEGDLADYLVLADARAHGCEAVSTFDGAVLGEDGFVAP